MGGQDALRGFEYQFMRTLEYAFAALEDKTIGATSLCVESPTNLDGQGIDSEAVDFTVQRGEQCIIAAQVKSGRTNSSLSASSALPILIRLINTPAEQYLLLTNRAPGKNLIALADTLSAAVSEPRGLSDKVLPLVEHAPNVRAQLLELTAHEWQQLARCRISVDVRTNVDLRRQLREWVRLLRPKYSVERPGWDAAGLLLGYLLSHILAKAAGDNATLTLDELRKLLIVDNETLATAVAGKNWASTVNAAPRLTDVARPDLLEEIAKSLKIPNPTPQVPACILSGLSGIGKTSIAAAWAADRADDYKAVFWIDASDKASLENSFRSVSFWLERNGDTDMPGDPLLDRVQGGLAALRQPWLIVFDNAPDSRTIKPWLPRSGLGHALVTTTDPTAWHGPYVSRITVPSMTPTQSTQLLKRRLFETIDLPLDAERKLLELAKELQNWPLALELASAYLADCHDGLDGIAEYRHLIMRSLSDEEAIPVGYPRTLVGAVLFALQRMRERAETRDSAKCALGALYFSSFLPSRLIPLHLLMACIWLEPREALQLEHQGPLPYRGQDPPIGEIYRDLIRDSLASSDQPIFYDGTGRNSPQSVGYSIAVNEIVQAVVRSELERLDVTKPVVTQLAFFAQHWLVGLLDRDHLGLGMTLLGQCCHLSEFAIVHGIGAFEIALLWGNTAATLARVDDWPRALAYLRAEDAYLSEAGSDDPTIAFITKAQLAAAITRSAHRPSDVIDEVTATLSWLAARTESAMQHNATQVSLQIINCSSLATELAQECPYRSDILELRQFFESRATALQSEQGFDTRGLEVLRINTLLREGMNEEAHDLGTRLAAESAFAFYHTTINRLLLEAKLALEDWSGALTIADNLREGVERDEVDYLDASSLVINGGIRCLSFNSAHNPKALQVLEVLINTVDIFAELRHPFRPGDEAKVNIFRAYLAAINGTQMEADIWLTWVDAAELELAEKGRQVGLVQLHRTLVRWSSTAAQIVSRAES
ncbi:hypothetical protein ACPXB1_17995 [Micromonospora sp. DT68]|uniref:hypothetical protein n=1 Tax=Micromonospora sp. DT68 TaxID=3416522 RepID=UPI003CF0BFDE